MFSAEDRPIDVETLEYAWLLELQLGTFSGKVTPPQVFYTMFTLYNYAVSENIHK